MLVFPAFDYYNGLLQGVFGYSIGAYIRLYVDVHSAKFRPRNLWIVILACAVVSATFTWLALDGGFIARSLGWVTQPAVGVQLTMPVIAAALFILFLRKDAAINRAFSHKKRLSTAIFALSAATFGVYLIHTNPFLWGTIFGVANSLTAWANNAPFLWKMSLLCLITVCIFALCAVAAITLDRLLSPAKKFLVAKITPRLAKLKIFAD